MNRLDYNRLIDKSVSGISDLLKNSASSSASPRLRVEIHGLDPPLTPPLAQPPSFPQTMNDDDSRCQLYEAPVANLNLIVSL
jgi:hypothetical protein